MKNAKDHLISEFSLHKRFMWITGLWPLDSKMYIFNIRWIIGMISEVSVTISTVMEFSKPYSEYSTSVELLLFMDVSFLSLMKNIFFRLRSGILKRNIEAASIDWLRPNDVQAYKLMKKYAKIGRVISIAFFISGYLCNISYLIGTVTDPWIPSKSSQKLIRNYLLPFGDLDEASDWEHRKIIFLQFLQMCIIHARQCVVDSFFFCIIMHLCAQFDILKANFLNFRGEFVTDTKFKRHLGELVRRHCELIDLVKNIEYTYHLIVLIQIMMSVILMGMTGLQFLMAYRKRTIYLLAKCLTVIVFCFMQTMMYAHAGQKLLEESRNVLLTMYDTTWQNLPRTRAKDFMIVMMRSNMQFSVTGGKFFYMSYATFAGMARRLFSYVSFLQLTVGMND